VQELRTCPEWFAWWAALAIGLGSVSRVCAQSAAPVHDVVLAENYAAQAFEAYEKREYASAIALYEKAHAAAPSADALYNIARIQDVGLHDRPLAIQSYQRYLSDPGALPERMRRAQLRMTELQRAEAEELAATSAPEVTSRPVAPAPAPKVAATPITPITMVSHDGWSPFRVAALVTGTVGLVGVGVGTGFGLSVLADADAVNADCNGNRCASQRGVDLARSASGRASAATVGIGFGAGLMVTGAALWLLDPARTPVEERGVSLRLTPVASSSKLVMRLSGAW
jgi:tetratricopeptide (TPR) repeat protein